MDHTGLGPILGLYSMHKHVLRQGFKGVLNREASYTLLF